MPYILTIGYQEFVLPDKTNINQLLQVLRTARPCNHNPFASPPRLVLERKTHRIEIACLAVDTIITEEPEASEKIDSTRPAKPTATDLVVVPHPPRRVPRPLLPGANT